MEKIQFLLTILTNGKGHRGTDAYLSWSKIPNGRTTGQASSAANDAEDNIWLSHRPGTVNPVWKRGASDGVRYRDVKKRN